MVDHPPKRLSKAFFAEDAVLRALPSDTFDGSALKYSQKFMRSLSDTASGTVSRQSRKAPGL
jgi:hypothetical protein